MVYAVPSPALAITAAEVLAKVSTLGGRAFRAQRDRAFVLTDNPELAEYLIRLGGKPHSKGVPDIQPLGGYWRAPGVREWDIWVEMIPVTGEPVREALRADA